MKLVLLKDVMESLETLKDAYEDLKDQIRDEVRDDEIEKATRHFEKLKSLQASIKQMENLQVQTQSGKDDNQ